MNRSAIRLLPAGLCAAALTAASPSFAAGESPAAVSSATTRPAGYQPLEGDAKLGERLWKSTKLSSNGMSCNTCHAKHGAFQATFAQPYPHMVQMAKDQLGQKVVHLDEMIQACMVMPMEAKPLPWNSKELAALVAYTRLEQKSFQASLNKK